MVRFGERKIAKEKFYATKKPVKIWDVTLRSLIDGPSPPPHLLIFRKSSAQDILIPHTPAY